MKTKIFINGCIFILLLSKQQITYSQVVDDSVTINFNVPGVSSVKAVCNGISWFAGSDTVTLDYLGNSNWRKTLKEVPAGFYYYRILINEAPVYDQASFAYFATGTWVSAFEVSDTGNNFFEVKTGPFGAIYENIFNLGKPDKYRKCKVYVPACYYDNTSEEYPVVYLLPDSGENSSAWVYQGKIRNIMDNAIADGTIDPMIVVLPDLNTYNPDGSIDLEAGRPDSILIKELIPFVDLNYKTLDSAKYRAIAGCSWGGLQAMKIVRNHYDLFDNLGIFSLPASFDTSSLDFEQFKILGPSVFLLGAGSHDSSYENIQKLHNGLTDTSIAHQFEVLEGSYNWLTWRTNLFNMLQLLFKE